MSESYTPHPRWRTLYAFKPLYASIDTQFQLDPVIEYKHHGANNVDSKSVPKTSKTQTAKIHRTTS